MDKDKSLPCFLTIAFLLVFLTLGIHGGVASSSVARSRRCKLFSDTNYCDVDVRFGVLLDAGSSSTKLKIYMVVQKKGSSSLPDIQIIHNQRFSPGLDSFANDATRYKTKKYLAGIIKAAKEKVPIYKQTDAPILLFATAGLRFLTAATASKLLDNTKAILRDTKINPFKYKPSTVGILSGEEEGVYAWVALNYLLGFFDKNGPANESVGILEMGGGSTQIAFTPNDPLYQGEYRVRILQRNYDLYVHSYLQFGTNAITLWIAETLLQTQPGSINLDNPCMLRGDVSEIRRENGQILKLSGTSNPALCKDILKTVLAPETGLKCQPKPCAIGSVYQPSVANIKFYATQAFTYAPDSLKVVGTDEVLHLDRLEQAAFKHCARSLSESREAGIGDESASSSCLMGIYIPTLMTVSYRFPPDTANIKVTSKVGDSTIDWSLGLMVIELTGNTVMRRR